MQLRPRGRVWFIFEMRVPAAVMGVSMFLKGNISWTVGTVSCFKMHERTVANYLY
jgi:hypothetical protein